MKKTLALFSLLTLVMLVINGCSSVKLTTDTSLLSNTGADINTSGQISEQAKAIEKEIDLWPIYNDDKVGFSVNYPQDARLVTKNEFVKDDNNTYFKIDVRDIGQSDLPTDLTKEEAQKNIEMLSSGEFGVNHEGSLAISNKVKPIGFLFAQDFIVLSRFEVCNVTLERKLLFYFNNKQIMLSSYAPVAKLKELMPEYFVSDKDNCGDITRWDLDKQNDFYNTLLEKKAPIEIQSRFDNFEKLSQAIIFQHK